jgi:hypothetical protein
MMEVGSRLWVCKRWCKIVVPRPPVVPVRRIGGWEDIGSGESGRDRLTNSGKSVRL